MNYSVTKKGDLVYIQFQNMAPETVRALLKSKHCKWLPFQQRWQCTSTDHLKTMEAALTAAGWSRKGEVKPELVPLTASIKPTENGQDMVIQFNRGLSDGDAALQAALERLAVTPSLEDKRDWVTVASNMTAVRSTLANHGVTLDKRSKRRVREPAEAVVPTTYPANMRVGGNEIVLSFDVMPPVEKISELRGALAAVGVVVSKYTMIETTSQQP